jgi:formylglycine-generating enzyme required for sulfatase activity
MQTTEVTQSQYAAVMGKDPSFWDHGSGNTHPVERVSWDDAFQFCKRLTELDPEFEYRLPTEAEWEYACRAGQPACRYGDILKISWVFMNTDEGEGSTGHRPVGTKLPNKWGLHDLFGNVSEWCAD